MTGPTRADVAARRSSESTSDDVADLQADPRRAVRATDRVTTSVADRPSQQAAVHRYVAAPTWLQQRALAAIRFYQRSREGRLSPCRFFPSCSAYGHEAFEVHGTWRGGILTARRLLRCRPLGPSGVDLVPERDPSDGNRVIDTFDADHHCTPSPAATPAATPTPKGG